MSPRDFWKRGARIRQTLKNEWLHDFKVALIESDFKRMGVLQLSIPTFESVEEMTEAQALIEQAIRLFRAESDKTKSAMEQMRKAIRFQQSTLGNRLSKKFDKSY